MAKGSANFIASLESRAGNTLGYAFLGCITATVGWPLFVLWHFPGSARLIRVVAVDSLTSITWDMFVHVEILAAILGAGLGAICGARMGPLTSGAVGFLLGVLLEAIAFPLGLYTDFYPEGTPFWVLLLGVVLAAILGTIVGSLRARQDQMEHDLSLAQIREKSRRR
jgi:hypothetical protein